MKGVNAMRRLSRTLGSALLLGLLWTAAGNMGAQAADRYFSKAVAGKLAAQMKAALPPAPAGWKIVWTRGEPVRPTPLPGKEKVRKGYAPAAGRQYAPASGDQRVSLRAIYGTATDLDALDRRYRQAFPRWRKASVETIDGRRYFIFPAADAVIYYARAGSFALVGRASGKRLDKSIVLGLMRQVDGAKLKAVVQVQR